MSQASLLPAASGGVARERVVVDHERQKNDFYVDPAWCTELLLDALPFSGTIWDPCCGSGTIPKVAIARGFAAGGSDIVDRGWGTKHGPEFDFLNLAHGGVFENLIFNPPYKIAEQFILHAIKVASRKVAALVNLKFLASQGRRERLFLAHPSLQVLILSRRPSMPPGGSGIEAKGGTADYCWIVWENENSKWHDPVIRWLA